MDVEGESAFVCENCNMLDDSSSSVAVGVLFSPIFSVLHRFLMGEPISSSSSLSEHTVSSQQYQGLHTGVCLARAAKVKLGRPLLDDCKAVLVHLGLVGVKTTVGLRT
jgi:hypothetical protein